MTETKKPGEQVFPNKDLPVAEKHMPFKGEEKISLSHEHEIFPNLTTTPFCASKSASLECNRKPCRAYIVSLFTVHFRCVVDILVSSSP